MLVFNTFPYRHVSDIYLRHLHRHYHHYYRQKEIYTDIYTDKTVSTFSVHRPTAKLNTFPKLSQKRESGDLRRKGDYTLLYIGILRENGGDNVIEYQQLKSFIVQVEAISLCKLRHFHYAS